MTSAKPEPSPEQMLRARMLVFVMIGVILVIAAIGVARYFGLGEHIGLDLQGDRVTGTATPNADGSYRLRYETNDGIHARTYRGGFGLQRVQDREFEVDLVRDPERPNGFEPAGQSYLPGVLSLMIFCLGMACILHARRIVILQRREMTKKQA